MGLGPAAIQLSLDLWKQGLLKGANNIIEMGAQELHLKTEEFDGLVSIAGVPNYRKEEFSVLDNFPGTPRFPSRAFYGLLGIKEYSCIDFNGSYGSIPFDLNYPLEDKSLYGKYDIVTDFGTNEHVCNTGEAYRTMHRLCKRNGLILIEQGYYQGNGYFSYEPIFFEDMAMANGYEIISSSFTVSIRPTSIQGASEQFHVPLSKNLLSILDLSKVQNVGVCYVMRKVLDKDFVYSCQYHDYYNKSIHANGFRLQYLQNPVGRTYLPFSYEQLLSKKDLLKELYRRVIKKLNKERN